MVAARHPEAVVIGADTIVTLHGELLGKPTDGAEASAMLRRLRGRAHQVYSGVSILTPGTDEHDPTQSSTAVVKSTVWMRAYKDAEIDRYVSSGAPLDKAGAYGIQDTHFCPVARLRGCYASVMGLPLCHLVRLLSKALDPGDVALSDIPALCSKATGVPCCGGEAAELLLSR